AAGVVALGDDHTVDLKSDEIGDLAQFTLDPMFAGRAPGFISRGGEQVLPERVGNIVQGGAIGFITAVGEAQLCGRGCAIAEVGAIITPAAAALAIYREPQSV